MATYYNFTGDTRTVFLSRFNEENAKKENFVLARFIAWSRQAEDKSQKLQDEFKKICQVLEKDECPISKPKQGRQPKGKSPFKREGNALTGYSVITYLQSEVQLSGTHCVFARLCA